MKTYGLYINPYKTTFFYPSRLKNEAQEAGLAFWVKGESKEEALEHFINGCKREMKEYLTENKGNNKIIYIEEI